MNAANNFDARIERINREHHLHRRIFLVALVVGMIVNGALFWVATGPAHPGPTLMRFGDAYTTGATQLCPGEALFYTITLEVDKPGVFAIDISVWSVSPPSVALWSETRRVVFSEATTYTLPRVWTVPPLHPDPSTGDLVPWLPGRYERRHAISTTSRSTEPSIIEIPFEISEGCE